MRLIAVAIVLASALVGTAVQAQMRGDMTKVCGDEARRQKLAGTQLTDFLTKCWAGGLPTMSRKECEAEARKQGLSGEGLSAYMNKCSGG